MIVSHPCTHRDEFCIPKENESNISRRVHCGAILKEEYQEAMKKTIAIVLSLVLALATLAVRALWLGHVHINGQRATKVEEPLGYWLVIAAFCGCIYFLWPLFWGGLSSWIAHP